MSVIIFGNNRYFKIDSFAEGFTINNCEISTNKSRAANVVSKNGFVDCFGTLAFEQLNLDPYWFTSYEIPEHVSSFNEKLTFEMDISESVSSSVHNLYNCLWLLRDNSANIIEAHSYNENDRRGFNRQRDALFSNAKGEFETQTFSKKELRKAAEYAEKLRVLSGIQQIEGEPLEVPNEVRLGGMEYILYKSQNRIDRAIVFLSLARGNSYLPLKISFYIAILESLFTTDNNEVTHKVTERVVFYLEGSGTEKRSNFDLVKKAYGIRSKFVHGQKMDTKSVFWN